MYPPPGPEDEEQVEEVEAEEECRSRVEGRGAGHIRGWPSGMKAWRLELLFGVEGTDDTEAGKMDAN